MTNGIHTVILSPDWKLINDLSQIDKFGGSWSAIEKREGQSLKQLKSIATVRSVGASTRIEGSKMTNDEVERLIKNLAVAKLEERDAQEVAGYYETLHIISESFRDIAITLSEESIWERSLKSNEYPTKVAIEIVSEVDITFDVRFVYDAVIE